MGRTQRSWAAPLLAFLAVFLLIAGAVWLLASGPDADPSASEDAPTSDAATATAEPTSTASATSTVAAAPVTEPPASVDPATTTPVTTAPPATTPVSVTATTVPPVAPTAAPATVAPATAVPTTAPPFLMPAAEGGPIAEEEALAFVRTYYDQVAAGEYESTWPRLTQEFRDARNLTFESYARYWRNTSLELGDLRYTPGPGLQEGQVRFEARYTTDGRVVEETDELTLRREPDGSLVIAEQRIV